MAGVSGVSFILKVNTGTAAAPVYTALAGCKSATLSLKLGTIDVTDKDSNGWEEYIPNLKGWTVEFDGGVIEEDSTYEVLDDCLIGATTLKIQLLTPAGRTWTGSGILTDLSKEGPTDDKFGIKGTFQGTGALTRA